MPNGQPFSRPSLSKRLRGLLGDEIDWYSAPGHRGARKLFGHSDLPGPDFSKSHDFTPNLYDNLYALDVQDLGFRFRLFGWVRALEKGPYNGVRMLYVWPSFQAPTKCIYMEQIDLAPSGLRADRLMWREGEQELTLSIHQELHRSNGEPWFQHIGKQSIEIEAFRGGHAELDSWNGKERNYWILRTFVNEVKFLTVLSGFDERELGAVLGMLTPFEGNDRLAQWHENEHREYKKRTPFIE